MIKLAGSPYQGKDRREREGGGGKDVAPPGRADEWSGDILLFTCDCILFCVFLNCLSSSCVLSLALVSVSPLSPVLFGSRLCCYIQKSHSDQFVLLMYLVCPDGNHT